MFYSNVEYFYSNLFRTVGFAKGDSRVSELLNKTSIVIVPSVDPDGFDKAVEGQCTEKKVDDQVIPQAEPVSVETEFHFKGTLQNCLFVTK